MPRFIIIDHRTGYVVADTLQKSGPGYDPAEIYLRIATSCVRVEELAPQDSGFRVYRATDMGLPPQYDPRDPHVIETIEQQCSLTMKLRSTA